MMGTAPLPCSHNRHGTRTSHHLGVSPPNGLIWEMTKFPPLPERRSPGRYSVRGPAGRPGLTFEFLPRRPPCLEAAGRFGHIAKCPRMWVAVSRVPLSWLHSI